MEVARKHWEVRFRELISVSAVLTVGVLALLGGYWFEDLDLKTLALFCLGVSSLVLFFLPDEWMIHVLFVYIGIEGMLKVLTRYNPVVHIGVDLLVGLIIVRCLARFFFSYRAIPFAWPPLSTLFALHVVWFAIQFANPYSLGWFATLAGAKVYLTLVGMYMLGYFLATGPDPVRRWMATWVWVIALQCVTSLYQGWVGPSSVTSLSPVYGKMLEKFGSYAFRPFGTASNPGMPGVFVAMVCPLIAYFAFFGKSSWSRIGAWVLMPLAAVTMVICQVRSAILKAIVGTSLFMMRAFDRAEFKRRFLRPASLIVLIPLVFGVSKAVPYMVAVLGSENSDIDRAVERSLTLFDFDRASSARRGAAQRIVDHMDRVPLGAGPSHAGAAAGKFQDILSKDPFFPGGFFTDNFWALVIAEIGIPGALIMTLILGAILKTWLRQGTQLKDPEVRSMNAAIGAALFAIMVGLWGAEGVLYNPEGGYFWFFAGVLMRLAEIDTDLTVQKQSDALR